jgi:hypothetical protein
MPIYHPCLIKPHMIQVSTAKSFTMKQFYIRLWLLFTMLCGYAWSANAQTGQQALPEIVFTSGTFNMESAVFYPNQQKAIVGHDAARRLAQSFETTSLADYCNYFTPCACHVDTTTYAAWKSQLGDVRPVITASFELSSGNREYTVIKYTLGADQLTFSAAQLFTKFQNQWYFCSLDENVGHAELIMFFTLASEPFFHALKKEDPRLTASPCVVFQKQVNGKNLIDLYFDKYRQHSPCYDVLNLVFEDRIKSLPGKTETRNSEYNSYFDKSGIPADELDYLTRLVAAHQTHTAISHFSKLTGTAVDEIRTSIHKALHNEK